MALALVAMAIRVASLALTVVVLFISSRRVAALVLSPGVDRLVVLLRDVGNPMSLLSFGCRVEAFDVCVEILQCVGEFDGFSEGHVLVRTTLALDLGAVDTCDELLQDFFLHVTIEATVFSEGSQACSKFDR
jgi:hypothetical protein